ncbi:MAG: O-antigen ligase family protein [Patescibacteria group bacterium]
MTLAVILRRTIICGIFLTPFIPLIVANDFFFPFITGKNFTFRVIVEAIATLWVALALIDVTARPRRSVLLWATGAFVLSILVSAVVGENFHKSFFSNFERMEGWLGLAHMGAFFLVTTSVMQGEKIWRWFWNTSLAVSVVVGIYCVFQLAGLAEIHQGGTRIDATLGNATYLAVYMLFHVFIALLALARWTNGNKLLQLAYAAIAVFDAVLIFYSATRGSMLGLAGGLMLAGLVMVIWGKGLEKLRMAGAAMFIVVILAAGFLYMVKDSDYVKNHEIFGRLTSLSLSEGATRFTVWSMAIQGVMERPIFGWGQENFNYIFNKYYKASMYGQEPWFDRAHNVIMDWLVAGGIVGIVLYLSLYVIVIWYLFRPGSPFDVVEKALLIGLLAAHAFHNLFVFDQLVSYMFFFLILGYITTRAIPQNSIGTPVSSSTAQAALAGSVVLGALVFYFATAQNIYATRTIIEAIRPQESVTNPGTEDISINLANFKLVANHGGIGRQEIREQLVDFANRKAATPGYDQVVVTELVQLARDSFADEITKNPDDARLRIFMGAFLRGIGDTQGAQENLARASELSPEKQAIMFERGILELNAGNVQGAVDWFKKAYESEPNFEQARVFYAALAIRIKDFELADSLLMPHFGTRTPDDQYILQAYLDIGDLESALGILKGRLEKNPNSAQAHIDYALGLYKSRRDVEAVIELRKAIEIEPQFKAQGEAFIKEVEAGTAPR